MSYWFFLSAGGLSGIWLAVHLILGGRDIVRPLLTTSELNTVVRDTHYLCWHLTSVSIACMAGFFLWSALSGTDALAVAGVTLASGFAILGIALVLLRTGSHADLPQGWLFVPVAALGVAGLLA